MNPTTFTLAPTVGVANGIALSQTAAGAGNVTLNGSLVSGGVATFDVARPVAITSTSDLSLLTFTIIGTSRYGYSLTVTKTGPNNTTVYTSQDFLTVTSITISGSTSGNSFTIGTNDVVATQWYVGDFKTGKPLMGVIKVTGTLNYTVQFTQKDLNDQTLTVAQQIARLQNPDVFPSSDITVVNATTSQATTFIFPPPGARVLLNSFSSGASIDVTFLSPHNATA